MATVKDNYVMQGISGRVGKLFVNKIINGKTFVTKYPDRSNINYTKEQIQSREIFARAAKFASEIVNDPVKKAAYPRRGRISIYHCALTDFLYQHKEMKKKESSANKDQQ